MSRNSTIAYPISVGGGYDEVIVVGSRTEFRLNGKLHRVNGPAVIDRDIEQWWQHGQLIQSMEGAVR